VVVVFLSFSLPAIVVDSWAGLVMIGGQTDRVAFFPSLIWMLGRFFLVREWEEGKAYFFYCLVRRYEIPRLACVDS
jgi:hypothetical protein